MRCRGAGTAFTALACIHTHRSVDDAAQIVCKHRKSADVPCRFCNADTAVVSVSGQRSREEWRQRPRVAVENLCSTGSAISQLPLRIPCCDRHLGCGGLRGRGPRSRRASATGERAARERTSLCHLGQPQAPRMERQPARRRCWLSSLVRRAHLCNTRSHRSYPEPACLYCPSPRHARPPTGQARARGFCGPALALTSARPPAMPRCFRPCRPFCLPPLSVAICFRPRYRAGNLPPVHKTRTCSLRCFSSPLHSQPSSYKSFDLRVVHSLHIN